MLGIVFCGGQSLRMGTDKGLIPIQNQNWAMLAAGKIGMLNIPVKISISKRQKESYKHFFDEKLLLTDDENLEVKGPLSGLLSVHALYPDEDLFILACDLPLMQGSLLSRLSVADRKESDFEAFVFMNNGFAEPLCAIYKASGLKKIMNLLKSNQLSKHSMKYILSLLKIFELEISELEQGAFENFNNYGLT